MKRLLGRVLSILLTLALFVGLLSGLTLQTSAATVDYVYSGNYVYNWGTRGETATFLSPMAEDWYDKYNTSYDELSALSGSSSVSSVPSSALYKELQDLMSDAHKTITSYDDTRSMFAYTDCQNSGGKISSFYSGKAIGPSWDSGSTWNREHTWPNSKGEGSAENDIMMLRPTSVSENSSRGNTAYGKSSGYYNPNEQSGGTYDLRGDVVRIMLYVYCRWGNTTNMWGSGGVVENKDVLIEWMAADPVDTWELGRNDAVQAITGTRNVFVDYPELVFQLFSEDVPTDYDSPSGEGGASDFVITASSNNTSYGTVSVSGKTIIAAPNAGYAATGYTVTNGTATVTQNGNVFTVNASADCTVQINFAARTPATVTFSENGIQTSQIQGYVGDSLKLPEPTATPTDYTFIGWTTAEVDSATDKPSVTDKGATISVPGTVTYYALYSYTTAGGGGGTATWSLVTDASTLKAGDQLVIACNSKGFVAGDISSSVMASISATFSADKSTMTELPGSAVVLTLGGSSGAWTLSNSSSQKLGVTAVKKVAWGSGTMTWEISISSNNVTIQSTTDSYGRFLYNVNNPRFTTYTSNTSSSMLLPQLYRQEVVGGGSSTVYTTSACKHAHTQNVSAQAPTCTEGGYTAGVQCTDCDLFLSGHEPIAAAGHDYDSVIVPPTAEEDGYTDHTCSVCGDNYKDDYTDALGQTYTVSFSVPAGVTAVGSMSCNNTGILLPTVGAPDGYNFVGWIETQVNNVTEKPTYYAAGSKYVASGNVTLRALYTYTEGGNGNTGYTLTDIANIAASDVVVITVTTSDGTVYALNNDDAGKGPTASVVTKNGDSLTSEIDDIQKWNIAKEGNNLIIYPNGTTSEWLYCTSDNDGVRVGTNANKTFVIDTTSGYLKHTATSRYLGVYVSGSDWRCYTNTTGNTANQTLGFYVLGSGTTYYTTEIGGSTEPDEPDEPDEPEEFLLSFRVPNGVTQPESISGNGVFLLPEIDANEKTITIGETAYTFVGWVENLLPEDVTAAGKPETLAENASFNLDKNTTLYALYTYDVTTQVETSPGGSTESQEIEFALGANGTATHVDPNSSKTTYSETQGAYTLSISSGVNMYPGARDAKGNGCIKVGSSKNTGSFSFTVPQDVTSVVFYVAKYKDSTSKITINGTAYTLTKNSNDGAYDEIAVDTSANKTVSFASATGGVRCMINTIAFVVPGTVGEPTVEEITTTYYTTDINGAAVFEGANLTLGQLLGLHFHTDLSKQYLANASVQFTYFDKRTDTDKVVTVSVGSTTVDSNSGFYLFTVELPAVFMTTEVEAVLLYDGQALQTMSYTIQEYAMSIIGGSYEQKDKNAATAMLNYGAMAQNYFGYKTDALANSTLTNGKFTTTDAELAAAGDLTGYRATIQNRASNFIGYTLLLKDVTYIRLYFTEQVTVTLNGAEKTAVKDGDKARYYVEIPGVNAANLGTANTIVCGNMTIENLSVLSLASQVAKDTTKSEAFRNAMIALILYAQSVKTL